MLILQVAMVMSKMVFEERDKERCAHAEGTVKSFFIVIWHSIQADFEYFVTVLAIHLFKY